MKKFIVTTALIVFALSAFAQEETNGTIYIKHPYIDMVNKAMKAYLDQDDAANKAIYADTAMFRATGQGKPWSLTEALKMWKADFAYYDSIKLTQVGYPDFLHYKDMDAQTVQSWWRWSGKSKKSGKLLVINFVQFDDFNTDGKIAGEAMYGDFSKMMKD